MDRLFWLGHDMQYVILAGGLGTRMAHITEDLPKTLLPVNGEPFLRHKLRQLANNGVRDVVVSIGHLGDQVELEIADNCPAGMNVRCVSDGPDLLGTAGALRRLSFLGFLEEVFVLTYGDSFLTCDHRLVERSFDPIRFDGLMTVWSAGADIADGNCEVVGDRVSVYAKHDKSKELGSVDYGLSILKRAVLDGLVLVDERADLSSVFGHLASTRRLQAFRVSERYYEVGSEAGLAQLQQYLEGRALER